MFDQMTKEEKERLAIRYITAQQQRIMQELGEGKLSKEEAENKSKAVWGIWDKIVNGIGNFSKEEVEQLGNYIQKQEIITLEPSEILDINGKVIGTTKSQWFEDKNKKALIDNQSGDFLVDENGNVVINPNSGIPYPRYRRVDE